MEKILTVKLDNEYPVIISNNALCRIKDFYNCNNKVLLVYDKHVDISLIEIIKNQFVECRTFSAFFSETNKNQETAFDILNLLLENDFTKEDCIIGCGGGVVLDLCGFVASIYKRGLPFISIPTTMLSMCDSCLGGKNGIDFNGVKNAIGTIYQPKAIFIDYRFLNTLPINEYNNGLCEAFKMGILFDEDLVTTILNSDDMLNFDKIIIKSLEYKIAIVEQDEKDNNARKILNFGHSVGHAIESISNYKCKHGEAIAFGMLYETDNFKVIESLKLFTKKKNIILKVPLFDKTTLLEYFRNDKKYSNGYLDTVVIESLGKAYLKKKAVNEFIQEILDKEV